MLLESQHVALLRTELIHIHAHARTHPAQREDKNFDPVNGTRLETLFLIFNQGSKTDFKGHLS